MPNIYDMRMHDGSRHFASLRETYDVQTPQWDALRAHIEKIPGATITGFVTDNVTEAWIDWTYRGHDFSANNQHGDWWLFVGDPSCPDDILEHVLGDLSRLLEP